MRNPNRHGPSFMILILSLWSFSAAQTAADIRQLEQGKPIERELAGGEVHAYSIQLTAGQFLSVIVEQRGIDVVVVLFGPDGNQLIEVDSPNGLKGPEPVSFVAKSSGAHHIKVRSWGKGTAAGRYEVKIEALRQATPEDVQADRTIHLAVTLAGVKTEDEGVALLAKERELVTADLWKQLNERGRSQNGERAMITFRLGLRIAEQAGHKLGIATSLNNIGAIYHRRGELKPALEYFQRSLPIAEEIGEKRLITTLLGNMGDAYNQQGNFVEALEYHQKNLKLNEERGEKAGTANAQIGIGRILREQGKFFQALEAFQKSSAMFEALGDKLALANAMLDIGRTYDLQGNYTPALEYRQKALKLGEELGNNALIAQTFLNLGNLYRRQNNLVQALEYFQKELEMREKIGSKLEIARAQSIIGFIYGEQDKYILALEYSQKTLTFSELAGEKGLTAFALTTMGQAYQRQGKRAEAMEYFKRGLKLSEELHDKGGTARALNQIGVLYIVQGNYPQALEYNQQALKLNEELADKRGIATALNQIGNINYLLGNYPEALEYLHKSRKRREELDDRAGAGFTLHNIAKVYNSTGDYAQALEYSHRALKLREQLGQKMVVADSLNVIGVSHYYLRNYALSKEYTQKSLAIMEEIGVKRGVAIGLNNIGELDVAQGNYAQALEHYRKSLTLLESLGDKSLIASAIGSIGNTYFLQGDYAQALEYLSRSLALSEAVGEKRLITAMLSNIGRIHEKQGDYAKALEYALRSADIARQIGGREQLWEALTIAGVSYHKLDQLAQSRQAFEEAIATIESIRSGIGGQESRASFFAAVQRPYELYTDLLMQLHLRHPAEGNDALAVQVAERARARSLLEALSEARANIREGVDPVLVQHERTLQQRLNAAAERQTRLLTEKHTDEQVASVKKEIAALTAEFQDVQAQIRQRSPRYAALTQPVPLSLEEIQTTVLDADTLLLEYALGEERSYLWAVTPTSISSFELPKRSEIEIAVRSAVGLLSDGKQWTTSDKVESEYAKVASQLSQMLLAPVAAQLKGKRLLIVGDGALQYLPFGALPSPRSKVQSSRSRNGRQITGHGQPLIVEHEIVSLPSASTLAILRRETANRSLPTKSIAVLADPVFERDDERVSLAATGSQTASKAAASSASEETNSELANSRYLLDRAFGLGMQPATAEDGSSREILRISRLPFTRREADAILALAPDREGMKALDFRASRETATNAELAQYRIVHFATHGLLNSEHPELSGIVLSLVNEAGQPVDGFLRLNEVYNLRLSADMVVLSACQTGLGKEIRGEGLVGLTRGFMYAGSPRVVASLWKVADSASAELMTRFYRGMLKDNLRPAAALRAAKVEMWKQKRWSAPFYWAAFELQGEWK